MTPHLRSEKWERLELRSRCSLVPVDVVGLLHSVVDLLKCVLRPELSVLFEELSSVTTGAVELVLSHQCYKEHDFEGSIPIE